MKDEDIDGIEGEITTGEYIEFPDIPAFSEEEIERDLKKIKKQVECFKKEPTAEVKIKRLGKRVNDKSDSKSKTSNPPIINDYPEHENKEHIKQMKNYMMEKFGHIINSPDEMPAEVPTFDDLPDWVTKEESETKKDVALIKRDKKTSLAKKFDLGIISEKGFSNLVKQLILGESCEIKGNYSYKAHMILDFITHKLCYKNKEFMVHKVVDRDNENLITVDDIENHRTLWGSVRIRATDSEIKKTLGLTRMSNKDIFQAVADCADLEFEGSLYCYYDAETRELKSYDLGGSQKHFFGFVREKTERVASRTGYVENAYYFIFDTILSSILLTNIMNGNIQIKSKEFYQLRAGLQNLGNYILMWKAPTYINLNTLCALLGIKSKNTTQQQRYCEDNLNELKELGYITWVKFGKGSKARYKIWKKKRLLQPEAVVLLSEANANNGKKG